MEFNGILVLLSKEKNVPPNYKGGTAGIPEYNSIITKIYQKSKEVLLEKVL